MKISWTNLKYAESHYISIDDECDKYWELDKNKWNEVSSLKSKMCNELVEHCKEKGILFSTDYHEFGKYGVPVFDDKYFMFIDFAWGFLMARCTDVFVKKEECFSKEQEDELDYYLKTEEYSNTKLPIEVDGEICF